MNIAEKYQWIVEHPCLGGYFDADIKLVPFVLDDGTLMWESEVTFVDITEDGSMGKFYEDSLSISDTSCEAIINKLYETVKELYGEYTE